MEVVGVHEVLPSDTPVVLLRETDGERLLPIFIGLPEAKAIALALDGQEPPRPMTHDLMSTMLDAFSVSLEQVVVTDLRDRTFFAEVTLRGPAGIEVSVGGRPGERPGRRGPGGGVPGFSGVSATGGFRRLTSPSPDIRFALRARELPR